MKKLEFILAAVVLLSGILVVFEITIGFMLLILSTYFLSCLYLFFGFALLNGIGFKGIFKKTSYKNLNALSIALAAVSGWALSILIIGSLLKFNYYPGEIVLITGLILGALIIAFSGIMSFKNKRAIYYNVMIRLVFWIGIGVLLMYYNP